MQGRWKALLVSGNTILQNQSGGASTVFIYETFYLLELSCINLRQQKQQRNYIQKD